MTNTRILMEKIGVRTTDRESIYVSCRIMSFAKGGRRMKDTDYKDCDYKEVCCKNGFECGGCLYGAIYQLALKHEQEEKENKKMSTYS